MNSKRMVGWVILISVAIGVVCTYIFILSEERNWGRGEFYTNIVFAVSLVSAILILLTLIMVKKEYI